jgi:uncharacterized membrane protein
MTGDGYELGCRRDELKYAESRYEARGSESMVESCLPAHLFPLSLAFSHLHVPCTISIYAYLSAQACFGLSKRTAFVGLGWVGWVGRRRVYHVFYGISKYVSMLVIFFIVVACSWIWVLYTCVK